MSFNLNKAQSVGISNLVKVAEEVLQGENYRGSCGLYYKYTTIVNYASSIFNRLEALLTDNTRVIIYGHHVFIVQATEVTKF
jgi:hypothetical protein